MPILHEKIVGAIRQSRADLSRKRGYPIFPESAVCGFVSQDAAEKVGSDEVQPVSFELPTTTHHVVRSGRGRRTRIYDGQYQQFIPPERREAAPDILELEMRSPQKMLEVLLDAGMDESTARAYVRGVRRR